MEPVSTVANSYHLGIQTGQAPPLPRLDHIRTHLNSLSNKPQPKAPQSSLLKHQTQSSHSLIHTEPRKPVGKTVASAPGPGPGPLAGLRAGARRPGAVSKSLPCGNITSECQAGCGDYRVKRGGRNEQVDFVGSSSLALSLGGLVARFRRSDDVDPLLLFSNRCFDACSTALLKPKPEIRDEYPQRRPIVLRHVPGFSIGFSRRIFVFRVCGINNPTKQGSRQA